MSDYKKLKEMQEKAAAKGEIESRIASGEEAAAASRQQTKAQAPAGKGALSGETQMLGDSDSAKKESSAKSPAGKAQTATRARKAKPTQATGGASKPASPKSASPKARSPKPKRGPQASGTANSGVGVPQGNINVWIDGAVSDALEEYLFNENRDLRKRNEPKLTKTAVIERLLREMLDV